jgi:hypothetical protein
MSWRNEASLSKGEAGAQMEGVKGAVRIGVDDVFII